MSDERLDQLAESARHRGLRLVRSRVRTPGKRRYGKVGLTDASGKPLFGMDAKGPTASPDDIEDYLRNLGAKDWGASLDVAVLPRKRQARKAERPRPKAANDEDPEPKRPPPPPPPPPPRPPKPKPKSKPAVRDAKAKDAPVLVSLIKLLEHAVDEKGVRKRISALTKEKLAPLVVTLDKEVVGLCGIQRMVTIHRDQPVGRITILVVAEALRGQGIGRMLVDAAEERLRNLKCALIEITSNDRLTRAHAFYRHMGYERTGMRFAKKL